MFILLAITWSNTMWEDTNVRIHIDDLNEATISIFLFLFPFEDSYLKLRLSPVIGPCFSNVTKELNKVRALFISFIKLQNTLRHHLNLVSRDPWYQLTHTPRGGANCNTVLPCNTTCNAVKHTQLGYLLVMCSQGVATLHLTTYMLKCLIAHPNHSELLQKKND